MDLRSRPVRASVVVLLLGIIALAAWQIVRQIGEGYAEERLTAVLAQRRFTEAQTLLAERMQQRPDDPHLRLLAGQLARRRGDLPQAVRELEQCLTHGGDSGAVALEQRLAEIQWGDKTHADKYFRFCLANPQASESPLILEALVEGCLFTRDVTRLEEYLGCWENRSTDAADHSQTLLWRGRAAGLHRDLAGERRFYQEAVELQPDNDRARLALVRRLLDEDPSAAQQHLAVLQTQLPGDPDVAFQQAALQRNLGHLQSAADELERVLASHPKHVAALALRGRVALEQQQLPDAKRYLTQAERLSPLHPDVLRTMIDYLRSAGEQQESERYQQKVDAIKSEVEQRLAGEATP